MITTERDLEREKFDCKILAEVASVREKLLDIEIAVSRGDLGRAVSRAWEIVSIVNMLGWNASITRDAEVRRCD